MSQISMTSGGSDPAHNAPSQDATTHLSADLGEIMSSSTLMKSENFPQPRVSQRMPRNDLTDYLTRYTEINQFSVTDVSPAQGVSLTINPWRDFLLNSYIADKVSNYLLIRGTIEVLVIPAFPANGYGAYTLTAYPIGLNDNTVSASIGVNFASCMQTDHFSFIDVSACENCVMQLPFLWPYDYATISTLTSAAYDLMWDVRLWCLSPVQTAIPGGVTAGSFRVYARLLPDYELVVPSLQGKRGKSMVANKSITGMTGAADMVAGGKYKGAISGMADKISGVTSMLSGIPVIGPYAGVATKIADTVGDVASWFGFTREDAEKVPTTMVQRPISNAAHIDGDDMSEAATLSMANSISIDPLINGVSSSEDQMAFSSLFSRWTLIREFTWAPTASTSTTLGSIPISPFVCIGTTGTGTTAYFPTPAGYCGMPFKYWRGDMEYLIVIPVSKLHRGTLQIYWVPVGSNTTTSPTVSSLNVIYDVAADEEKQFSVGYARDSPFLYSALVSSDATIIPSGATNGRLVFSVVNPLQSQNSASSVDVLVFARAKSNMCFQVLTNGLSWYDTAGLHLASPQDAAFSYQGASGDEDKEEDTVFALVQESGEYPAAEINFGETVASARTMMQKFFWVDRTGGTTTLFNHLPSVVPSATPGVMQYDNHYAYLFHGIACGTRYKVLPVDPTVALLATAHMITPSINASINLTNDNLMPTQTCRSGGAEFRLPYYSPMKYQTMRAQTATPLYDYVSVLTSANVEAARRVCRACAPDIRVTCFAAVPKIVMHTGTFSGNPWS